MIRALAISCLLPFTLWGQASQSTDSALQAINNALQQYGKGASISGSSATKILSRMVLSKGCSATFEELTQHEIGSVSKKPVVNFATMSPDVQTKKWDKDSLWTVTVRNTSGQADIPQRTQSVILGQRKKSDEPTRFFELVLTDKAQAQLVANALVNAIRSCGGVARDPAVEANVRLEDSLASEKRKRESGFAPDTAYADLKQRCRDSLKPTLLNPESAIFPPDSSIVVFGNGKRMNVMMVVRAQNSFGALVPNSMACIFEKYGNAWVPVH